MPNTYINLTQKEFDRLKPINNNVIIEIVHRNEDDKTKSGLILVTDYNSIYANDIPSAEKHDCSQHLDRWGVVTKVPERLYFNDFKPKFRNQYNPKSWMMDWETDIEIKLGDQVWADYHSLLHSVILKVDDGKQYWVVNYQNLIVAKRKIGRRPVLEDYTLTIYETIPLNGHCLFTRINEGLKSKFIILEEKINKDQGIVKYTGSKNKNYAYRENRHKFDDIEINKDDKVLFRWDVETLLEDKQHRFFEDEDLRYAQRCDVAGILNN
jgi:co-chaperonin GroES (HSP10)